MATELVAKLHGGAAEREAAYTELFRREAENYANSGSGSGSGSGADSAFTEIAVACASPLCEVLSKPVAEVSVAEYHRASQLLTALIGVDPVRRAADHRADAARIAVGHGGEQAAQAGRAVGGDGRRRGVCAAGAAQVPVGAADDDIVAVFRSLPQ